MTANPLQESPDKIRPGKSVGGQWLGRLGFGAGCLGTRLWAMVLLILGLVLLGLAAELASRLPDGLEWAMARLGITTAPGSIWRAPLAEYAWPGHLPRWLQSVLSACVGGVLVWALVRLATRFLGRSGRS